MTYDDQLRACFEGCQLRVDDAMRKCVEWVYDGRIKFVDLVVCPESFTREYAVSVWPTTADVTVASADLLEVFAKSVPYGLDNNLDPYDVDDEGRSDLRSQCLPGQDCSKLKIFVSAQETR